MDDRQFRELDAPAGVPSPGNGAAFAVKSLSRPSRRTQRVRTVGPVADLERHLPEDWWRTIFNATYLQTDGDVVENADNTAQEVELLVRSTGMTTDTRVLDVCCGQGRHCLELARRGHRHVTGIDRSRYLVKLARKRARDEGLAVTVHEGEARRLKLREGPFDVVSLMGNSFGYFSSADDDLEVLRAVRGVLVPGGTVALDITDGAWLRAHFEPRSWEWIDANHLVCRERSLSADGSRLVCREVVVHAARGVIADQFYAQRLYDRQSLAVLLGAAGFDTVRDHAEVVGLSDRNQDLGMMEHRFFVTARVSTAAGKENLDGATGRTVSITPREDVLVLLGDPHRSDGLRPHGGYFTEDDTQAIARMRQALQALPGLSVRFHDDHATLWAALAARRPALVVNFCDEGYRNNLHAELHVPAMLEVLGIPYTGAGPACLGLCVDKSHVRAIAASLGIPVPAERCVAHDAGLETLDCELPAMVKPRAGDGSVGIDKGSLVHTLDALRARIRSLRASRPGDVLVQAFLPGAEYSVGLVGNPGIDLEALPVLEVDYDSLPADLPPILGYESKWNDPPTPYWTEVRYREARLSPSAREALVQHARALFADLGCRDYARFDFRTGRDGVVRFLEANPNPGWGWGDEMNYMAGWAGLTYPDLLGRIIQAARRRASRPG